MARLTKRRLLLAGILLLCVAAVLFFPITKTRTISGSGVVLTKDKEKIGDCTLTLEIRETGSLAADYRRHFSFVLHDGQTTEEYDTKKALQGRTFVDRHDGVCMIASMYSGYRTGYKVVRCDLLYAEDLSYAALLWEDRLYYLPNGTDMPYSEIPWTIG